MISKRNRPRWSAIGMALIFCSVAGAHSTVQSAPPNQIVIRDFMFSPNPLTVRSGATVTWINMDEEPHTVVSNTRMFRSRALDTRESFSFKFTDPGTYHFTSSMLPRMTGVVIVQ
jgi:plastocyanin